LRATSAQTLIVGKWHFTNATAVRFSTARLVVAQLLSLSETRSDLIERETWRTKITQRLATNRSNGCDFALKVASGCDKTS